MGGFFLYKKGSDINLSGALEEFGKKGFDEPASFSLGDWELILYRKLLADADCTAEAEGGFAALSGSAMYGRHDLGETVSAVLRDMLSGTFNQSALRGHFNLITYTGGKLRIMTDALISKRFFCDGTYSFFTSSMLAAAAAHQGRLHVNKMAVYEKMMTGIIVSPDTVFEEIISVNRSVAEEIAKSGGRIEFIFPEKGLSDNVRFGRSFKADIQKQIDTLDGYFTQLSDTVGSRMTDTGLSGGYDSRLVYCMLLRHLSGRVHVHTHDTKNVHGGEKKTALELARLGGLDCNTVPTVTPDMHEVDFTELMLDNMHFFDGRSSFVIGGFNETYTAGYRKMATEASPVTLSGMGGEVYRNYYHVTNKRIPFRRFMKKHIAVPEFEKSLKNSSEAEAVLDYAIKKAEAALGDPLADKKGIIHTRRYYSEIMMSEGQAVVIDAYNQVSAFFAPFIDSENLRSAYTDTYLIGSNGCYEAGMINTLNPGLAKVASTYGHDLTHVPLSYRIKQNIRAKIPKKLWAKTAAIITGRRSQARDRLQTALDRNEDFKKAFDMFKKIFPDIDFDILMQGKYVLKNISMLIIVFYYFRDKLTLD